MTILLHAYSSTPYTCIIHYVYIIVINMKSLEKSLCASYKMISYEGVQCMHIAVTITVVTN